MAGVGIGKKIAKARTPRVHITYDLYLPDTSVGYQTKELPMVIGVLANFIGQGKKDYPKFRDRRFIEINEKNFDLVMSKLEPMVEFQVPSKLGADTPLQVTYTPKSIFDFGPAGLAKCIPELKALWDVRETLKAAMAKLDGNDKAVNMILEAIKGGQAAGLITAETKEGAK